MAEAEEGKRSKWRKYSPKYLLQDIPAKDNAKNTLKKSGAQIVAGVIAGAACTAIIGRWSFLTGAGLIGLGNYKDISWLPVVGTGMMASALMAEYDQLQGVEGFDFKTEAENAKHRLLNLKDSFFRQTYLDKVFAKKEPASKNSSSSKKQISTEEAQDVNGLYDVPHDAAAELDKIHQQLIASAMQFQREQQGTKEVGAVDPDLMGLEEEVDFSSM